MEIDDAIEFLDAKCSHLAELVENESDRQQVKTFSTALDALCRDPGISMSALRSLDRDGLEAMLDSLAAGTIVAEVRRRLTEKFGVSRLSPSDRSVVRQVLKRGEVATSDEYYQLKELIETGPAGTGLSEALFEELEMMVESFVDPGDDESESDRTPKIVPGRKSRRIAPPPFDLTLVDDERLCPPETTDETKVAFIQAKFAKVMACPMPPEYRAVLERQLHWGLEFCRGALSALERPGERHEHCEHEAEYFVGYEVTGVQHRAIERDLEESFGFRRLALTAQGRLARMLATNEAGTRANRNIIERFLKKYPHQTLFTRADLKRAQALLKQPLPGMTAGPPPSPPRPPTASRLPLLRPGAVFRVPFSERLVRLLAADAIEVFYDCDWGENMGWGLQSARRKVFFYRHPALWFLDRAEHLRIDPLSEKVLAAIRTDLPLRFGRSARLDWRKDGFATKTELEAHVRAIDPELLQTTPLQTNRVKLYPFSARGAMKPGVLVKAVDDVVIPFLDLLWHACLHQVPSTVPSRTGIGFFRVGFERDGTPSYYLGGYDDNGAATRWHREAPERAESDQTNR